MSRKLLIMDWLVHGGHQYEFFKLNHNFYCTKLDGNPPLQSDFGRPRNNGVLYVKERLARARPFDIIMVRAGLNHKRYDFFRKKGTPRGIAVIQTHTPFSVPSWVDAVVWNSYVVMKKYKSRFPGKKHYHIAHGFDPNEFRKLDLKRNGRVISVNNVFKKRGDLLGFSDWAKVSKKTGICDLVGHGNDDLKESIGCYPLNDLVEKLNEYSVYLNTTIASAMPRSRAEALMCGTPIVTTKNYDIDMYLKDKKHCLYANSKSEMVEAINKILSSKSLAEDLSEYGREAAIKHFNINLYLQKWERVFEDLRR